MKEASKMSHSIIFGALLACLIVAGSGSSLAQTAIRNDKTQIFTFTCPNGDGCPDWNETVTITEPADPVPTVVTFSARYFVDKADIYYVGLNVNSAGCQTGVYGPSNLDDIATNPSGHFLTVTFQWLVLPSDGVLIGGKANTFELCGGGDDKVAGDSINISQNTLSVAKY